MNDKIKEFAKKHEPKFTLKKYTDEILYLIVNGYSQDQVLLYLKESYDVSTTRQTLSSHLKYLKKTKAVRTEPQKKASESENKSVGAGAYALPKTLSGSEFVAKVKSLGEPN